MTHQKYIFHWNSCFSISISNFLEIKEEANISEQNDMSTLVHKIWRKRYFDFFPLSKYEKSFPPSTFFLPKAKYFEHKKEKKEFSFVEESWKSFGCSFFWRWPGFLTTRTLISVVIFLIIYLNSYMIDVLFKFMS